ncbi:hypothetical protein BH09PAT4_BH09PAT4_09380 [soil metagenome]
MDKELEQYYSVKDLTQVFSISRQQLYKMVHNGTLHSVRLPNTECIRIPASAVSAYLSQIRTSNENDLEKEK